MKLTAAARHSKPRSSFAGGGPKGKEGFYIGDKSHARAAISGATRSANAGNISASEASRIKAKARAKLGTDPASKPITYK
jgi:hypothetical protein